MKGRHISYSDAELAWIEARKAQPRRTAHAAFVRRFARTDVSLHNFKALCTRKGWQTGRTGCFAKGQVPANKGRRMPFNANSAATRFRKGHRPHNTRWAGHERVSKDGYVEISVPEVNPHTGFERRYVLKHRWLWEQANGPVPAGMCLKCLDGNSQNTAPENWEAVPRALLPRLVAGRWRKPYQDFEPATRPAVLTIARLEHQLRLARAPRSGKVD